MWYPRVAPSLLSICKYDNDLELLIFSKSVLAPYKLIFISGLVLASEPAVIIWASARAICMHVCMAFAPSVTATH